MNLTLGLYMNEYVRYGRTKIVSAKPHAAKFAGGLLGGPRLAPSAGTASCVETGLWG